MKTKVWIKMNKKSQALRLRKWSKKNLTLSMRGTLPYGVDFSKCWK
jgi:hypothetical protein